MNAEKYPRLLAYLEQLMKKNQEDLSPKEQTLLDTMVTIIELYEQHYIPLPDASPHDLLHHLMEARQLTNKDIAPLFGSKGVASEVLHGKRGISVAMAKKLGNFFHVSPTLFLELS